MARYRGPAAGTIRAVPLDALTACYHRPSGITHLLAAPAPEILDAIGDGWIEVPALLDRLAARFELADADPGALVARLDELVAAGLAERR